MRDQSISGFGRHQGELIGLHSKILSLSKFISSNSGFTLKPNGGFNVEVGISLAYSSENGKLNIQSLTGLSGYCETRTVYCVASCSLRRAKGGSP